MQRAEPTEEHPLRLTVRPDFELGEKTLRVADLFSGCGGLTLGVAQAVQASDRGLDIAFAVDADADAVAVYKSNFPKAFVVSQPIEEIFGSPVGSEVGSQERQWAEKIGAVDALIGGPPCQGHSNLNNHTRRDDPKNALYLNMARAAEVLRPGVVVIENVPTVQHDKQNVVGVARAFMSDLGYKVSENVIRLEHLGVPQTRRRHIFLATTDDWPDPGDVFKCLLGESSQRRDLRWAIEDLVDREGQTGIDKIPDANPLNTMRMQWLLDNDKYDLPNEKRPKCHQDGHTYKSMYGRLKWDQPAQTITSGFSSIGQGRYMHPERRRALTAHEAARIQGFPDYFDFSAATSRKSLTTMIGNAVPPELGRRIFEILLRGPAHAECFRSAPKLDA